MKHSVTFLLNFYYSNGVNAFLVLFALPKNTRIFHLHIYLYMTEHFIILCNIIFLIYFSYHFSILFWGSKMQNFKFGNAELFLSLCLCKTNCYIAVILVLKKRVILHSIYMIIDDFLFAVFISTISRRPFIVVRQVIFRID